MVLSWSLSLSLHHRVSLVFVSQNVINSLSNTRSIHLPNWEMSLSVIVFRTALRTLWQPTMKVPKRGKWAGPMRSSSLHSVITKRRTNHFRRDSRLLVVYLLLLYFYGRLCQCETNWRRICQCFHYSIHSWGMSFEWLCRACFSWPCSYTSTADVWAWIQT